MSLTDLQRIAEQQQHPRVVELWLELQTLRSCVSFMNTGAHPDDETSPMLAALGLRDGVKLSHACSTRGEGGQNALGLEVTKDLGIVRTREMERAAKVLNMTHYWLSETPEDTIFDFGFSKSGIETLNYWDEQRTLERFVLILRRERPDIICPTFLDIPGQHGHHRAMTKSAFDAVKAAADPKAFPEQGLDAWQVKKLYLPAWSGAGDAYDDDVPPPLKTTQIDATGADPVLGADYAQIGQWSRAFHKTQQMGRWIDPGLPSVWPLNLAWSAIGDEKTETDIFADLPKTLADLAHFAGAPVLHALLAAAQVEMNAMVAGWPNDKMLISHGATALGLIREAKEACPDKAKGEIIHRLGAKERQLSKILLRANSITLRTALSQSEVRPGEEIDLNLHLHAPEISVMAEIVAPSGWHVSDWEKGNCKIAIPQNAPPSDCYPDTWLADQQNDPLHLVLSWMQGDQQVRVPVDLQEKLTVLPAYSATLSPAAALINLSSPKPILVALSDVFPPKANGEFTPQPGWEIARDGTDFTLSPNADLTAGLYHFPVPLEGQDAQTIHRMDYEHTGPLVRPEACVLNVRALDVALPDAKIAYIGGGSDRTDYWLRAIGMDVVSFDDRALAQADFSQFDSILIGIFALRTRPILARRLGEIHDWVREGGNLVTLYHRPWDNWHPDKSALAPLTIGKPSLRWRVTDEKAKITHLVPEHPLLNALNTITQEDWQGWQKERGLYFVSDWDDAYTPLLSMADPDEQPLKGALLSGKFGKGRHTHTSLVLHYQLEKLVPGAYRLLANLLNPG